MPIPFGITSARPFATVPAAASWAAKLGDSLADTTIAYGEWFENICAHFAWKPINDNLWPNGSFEADITDVLLQAGGAGTAAAKDATHAFHGTSALKLTGPTTPGLFYYSIGGQVPAVLTCTVGGGTINSVAVTATGAGYDGCIITAAGGGGTATFAVAVDSTGVIKAVKVITSSGYSSAPTLTPSVGTGATLTPVMAGVAPNQTIASVTVAAGGTGFPPSPTCYQTGGTGAGGATLIPYVDGTGTLAQGAFILAGGAYTVAPTLLIQTMRPYSRAYLSQGTASSQAYTLNWRAYIPSSGGVPRTAATTFVQVNMTDQSNALTQVTSYMTGAADAYVQYSATFTTPANCAMVYVQIGSTTTGANQTMWIDGVQLVKGASVVPATYCDWTDRGGISGAPIANVTGSTNTAIATLVPTAIRGSGNSLLAGGAGISSHQSTVANRVTKHTATNIIFVEGGLNDLRYASAANGGNATALSQISTALDTILAALVAMSGPPQIVILGVTEFNEPPAQSAWSTTLPTGYLSYHDYADAMDNLLMRKAAQYGALFVPLRARMGIGAILIGDIHPTVPYGHAIISELVIRAIEQGS